MVLKMACSRETVEQEAIRVNFAELVRTIRVNSLLDHLYQDGIISSEEKQRIKAGETQEDCTRRLLDLIVVAARQTDNFSIFLNRLEEENNFLYELLGETVTQLRRKRRMPSGLNRNNFDREDPTQSAVEHGESDTENQDQMTMVKTPVPVETRRAVAVTQGCGKLTLNIPPSGVPQEQNIPDIVEDYRVLGGSNGGFPDLVVNVDNVGNFKCNHTENPPQGFDDVDMPGPGISHQSLDDSSDMVSPLPEGGEMPRHINEYRHQRSIEAGKVMSRESRNGCSLIRKRPHGVKPRPSSRHYTTIFSGNFVFLRKTDPDTTFGFSIKDSIESRYKTFIVSDIEPNGLVATGDRLHVGDIVSAINGIECPDLTLPEANELIRNTEVQLVMRVRRPGFQYRCIPCVVILVRRELETYGFNFIAGCQRPREPADDSLFVTDITPGSVADNIGYLQPGDVITSINDQSTEGVKYIDAQHMLKKTGTRLEMTIERIEYTCPL